MASRRKKPEQPQEEGAPAWMNTYGDMVTLVLTFFVLLFSFSTIDAKKWEELVNSFSGQRFVAIQPLDPGALEHGEYSETVTAEPQPSVKPTTNDIEAMQQFDELYQKIRDHIKDNKLEAKLNVEKNGDVILLHITDSALFDSGKDVIKPDAKKLLKKVAAIFSQYERSIKMIRIEGHTDNVPIHTARFENNLILSCSRASTVWEYFIDTSEIEPGRYSATGYGEYHPIATNKTEEDKAKNRRVDFVIESIERLD